MFANPEHCPYARMSDNVLELPPAVFFVCVKAASSLARSLQVLGKIRGRYDSFQVLAE